MDNEINSKLLIPSCPSFLIIPFVANLARAPNYTELLDRIIRSSLFNESSQVQLLTEN